MPPSSCYHFSTYIPFYTTINIDNFQKFQPSPINYFHLYVASILYIFHSHCNFLQESRFVYLLKKPILWHGFKKLYHLYWVIVTQYETQKTQTFHIFKDYITISFRKKKSLSHNVIRSSNCYVDTWNWCTDFSISVSYKQVREVYTYEYTRKEYVLIGGSDKNPFGSILKYRNNSFLFYTFHLLYSTAYPSTSSTSILLYLTTNHKLFHKKYQNPLTPLTLLPKFATIW